MTDSSTLFSHLLAIYPYINFILHILVSSSVNVHCRNIVSPVLNYGPQTVVGLVLNDLFNQGSSRWRWVCFSGPWVTRSWISVAPCLFFTDCLLLRWKRIGDKLIDGSYIFYRKKGYRVIYHWSLVLSMIRIRLLWYGWLMLTKKSETIGISKIETNKVVESSSISFWVPIALALQLVINIEPMCQTRIRVIIGSQLPNTRLKFMKIVNWYVNAQFSDNRLIVDKSQIGHHLTDSRKQHVILLN